MVGGELKEEGEEEKEEEEGEEYEEKEGEKKEEEAVAVLVVNDFTTPCSTRKKQEPNSVCLYMLTL